jgi:hypothetical protein
MPVTPTCSYVTGQTTFIPIGVPVNPKPQKYSSRGILL